MSRYHSQFEEGETFWLLVRCEDCGCPVVDQDDHDKFHLRIDGIERMLKRHIGLEGEWRHNR